MNMCFWRQANALPNTSDAQKNAIVNAYVQEAFFFAAEVWAWE